MLRFTKPFLQAASAAAAATAPASAALPKMAVLHKMLTGELSFKHNVPLKSCYVEESFGSAWESELKEYAKKLTKSDQDVLNRQVQRLRLTRYTTRELSQYLPIGGTSRLEAVAREAQIEEARVFLLSKGEQEFRAMVEQEGKLANWTPEICGNFIAEVLKKK